MACLLALLAGYLSLAPQAPLTTPPAPVTLTLTVHRPGSATALESTSPIYRGEVLVVDLELQMPTEVREHQLLSRWRLPLDLALALDTPWLDGTSGYRLLPPTMEESGGVSLVLDRERGMIAEVSSADPAQAHYRLRRRILINTTGPFTLPAASLQIRWATRFQEDLVRGPVPVDAEDAVVSTEAWQGNAVDLPTLARPPSFAGAVGHYRWWATASPVTDGSWSLSMTVQGDGILEAEQLPRLDGLPHLPLLGSRVEILPDGLRLEAEFRVEPDAKGLPPLSWASFDPAAGSYRRWQLPALALGAGEVEAIPWPGEGASDTQAASRSRWWWLAPAAILLFLLGWRRWPRRSHPALAASAGLPQPRSRVPTRIAPPPIAPPRQDLLDDLALCLSLDRAEVYDADLQALLLQHGADEDLAVTLAATVIALREARYGNSQPAPSAAVQEALRERLLLVEEFLQLLRREA